MRVVAPAETSLDTGIPDGAATGQRSHGEAEKCEDQEAEKDVSERGHLREECCARAGNIEEVNSATCGVKSSETQILDQRQALTLASR